LAANLEAEGKHAEAAQLFRKALDINRKILGEQHPNTAKAYSNLAMNLCVQGKSSGASQTLLQAVQAYEASRLNAAAGIERAQLSDVNPRLLLAALQQATEPAAAWENVELSLARGLLDQQRDNRRDLTPLEQSEWTKETERVAALNPQILYLATRPKRSTDEKAELDQLIADRRQAEERLAALDVLASTRGVARPEAIRAALAADAAVLCWIDVAHSTDKIQEHWACVVRRDGEPHWVRLPGTGPEASWTSDDSTLPSKLRAELRQERPSPTVSGLAAMLRAQRIEPVLKHLEGVKTLYVIGVNEMAGIPVDLLAPEFTTSYVPSGTFLARRGQPRQKPVTLLVMGDPVFPPVEKQVVSTASPPGGLLITQVVPEGAAAKAGVRVNDVLVAYAGQEIDDVDHLGKLIADNAERKDLTLKIWRETEDKLFERDVVPGRLGVALAAEPAVQAIKARRDAEMMLANLNRGGSWDELPGTQVEVAQLERLFPKDHVTRLTRSEANEQTLESLRKMGELAKFRFLHFATHGEANNVRAFDSALILSQDSLPEEPKVQNGEAYLNGQLTASEVLELWNGKLDADLVTLSACETAIGKSGGGDGMLGFAQAFLLAGSRSVCLSLWKVDDTATTLVMDRFYRNLLGKREDGAQPIGKAAALHEAKTWLRNLTLAEATDRLGVLTDGVSRGSKKGREVIGEVPIAKDSAGDSKPYSHPKYWAAFILIGDPD
jgi:CHAT domain-containing protein/tetratricopeptide (TPR) repeat protein